jgi:hypothetical protein
MSKRDILNKMPKNGFIKTSRSERPKLTGQQKSVLVRRGNELFNEGHIEQAKKIFVTIGYTDGIIRLGDYYYQANNHLEAFRMYVLAPDKKKVEMMTEKMALVVRNWLLQDKIIKENNGRE